ncbi:MAG: hypothetical protein M3198_16725 [Actinomycetota bacterium]|nr:hypothetical protein [Actinomycetota bacterium]
MGGLFIAVLGLAFGSFPIAANATPGVYHTAIGSGTSLIENVGDSFSIAASDRPGFYGSIIFNGVAVELTCVVIQDGKVSLARTEVDGHILYASGMGSDGKSYFAKVTAGPGVGNFLISEGRHVGNKCDAPEWYGVEGPGSFVIAPV